uniref:Uncharacterized protein n=1 Tax=Candidatus Kentrum sp. MB TaxID=2138164 RepID=A0A451B9U9_9GAMM|nr:MAG: hypothetical protein BECKMB1821I_GA0114274_101359 [Candidatus Kentron sp. MB]VFK75063.1 MAG: hypothetical protein BECKMB1821H_GA0114242_101459 [Candidatus Kentron sp. MB]
MATITTQPITTQPATPTEVTLSDACRKEIVKQVKRLDDLGKELLKIQLIIPGIYTAVLKLVGDGDLCLASSTTGNIITGLAFLFWIIAIACTLWGIFPKRYDVQCDAVARVPAAALPETREPGESTTLPLTAREFFEKSAEHKRKYLTWAVALFFIGVVCAALAVFF